MKRTYKFIVILLLVSAQLKTFSQDKKFYIFLSFGQSNMEGNARIRPEDTVNIDSRFQVMEAVDCPDLKRIKGHWYTAVPPLWPLPHRPYFNGFFWQDHGCKFTKGCKGRHN